MNASTWYDYTNYYEVVPKQFLSTAIEIEADRMRHARIREEDRISEMPVVRNEFERIENNPYMVLAQMMQSAAFIAHPYHHDTIGWRSDIENVSIERLQQFYNDFYWPDNATVTITGDFDETEVLNLVKQEFGRHPKKSDEYPRMYTEEPEQQGERRVIVKRAGMSVVGVAYKIPNALHADIPALLVLASVLAEDKTSRLHRALVDKSLATDVSIHCWQFRDPGLFSAFVALTPDSDHGTVEEAVRRTYKDVVLSGVTAAEVRRAKAAVRRQTAERRDGAYALLSALNEDIATGDWTRFVTLPDAIERVSPADVKRVAKAYFNDDASTIGWFINTAV